MTDSKSVRNMQSSLPNKVEKYRISLASIISTHHDARSSECQINTEISRAKLQKQCYQLQTQRLAFQNISPLSS